MGAPGERQEGSGGESGGRGGSGGEVSGWVLGNRLGVLQGGWAGGGGKEGYRGGIWGALHFGDEGVTSTGTGRVTGCSGSDLLRRGGGSAGPGPLFP